MMKTLPETHSIRNTLMAIVAVSAMALPLISSASTANIKVSFDPIELDSARGQERLYEELKDASRKLCGSTDVRMSGSLSQSAKNKKCYSGTLTAVVNRLGNESIIALHSQ